MQFDLRTMAEHMGGVAWAVVIILSIMSVYSIAVMIERYWTYSQATKQSRKYAPEVARYLKQGKIKEAIDIYRTVYKGPNDYLGQGLYNLGVVTREGGNPKAAIPILEEAAHEEFARFVVDDDGPRQFRSDIGCASAEGALWIELAIGT